MTRTASTAKTDIENAAREAVRVIATATESAAKIIANAASEATKVVANNATEAAKVVATVSGGDHDLLVELRTDMRAVKETLQTISEKEDTHLTKADFAEFVKANDIVHNDHENRIRLLEQNRWVIAGGISVIVMLIGFAVAYALKLIH